MVKKGQASIRRVRFCRPPPSVGDIEVNTLRGIRDRGGPHEFLTSQRLDFDLLVHIESGAAVHTVDFTDHPLQPGDILWVRAGQVHRWGAISDIEGTVVMFGPNSIDDRTTRPDQVPSGRSAAATGPPPTWRARLPAQALDLLDQRRRVAGGGSKRSAPGRAWALPGALLVELTLVQRSGRRASPQDRPTRSSAGSEITSRSTSASWHKVSEYADRLGYSHALSTVSPASTQGSPRRNSSTRASF